MSCSLLSLLLGYQNDYKIQGARPSFNETAQAWEIVPEWLVVQMLQVTEHRDSQEYSVSSTLEGSMYG